MDPYGAAASSEDANPPRLFINWEVLQQLLQEHTDGVHVKHTLLLNLDGSLLTTSHDTPQTKAAVAAAAAATAASPSLVSSVSSSPPVLPKILGALVANIWKTAESNGVNFLHSQQLNMMSLDCEGGTVMVSRLSRFLICIYATKGIQAGMLRLKMNELITNLQPLTTVYAQ